jgi:holo-[acyl-carrier protein] synthase
MIIGIGMDLVEVERVGRLLSRHPLRAQARLFTSGEVDHCMTSRNSAESFAARFAAKEAVFKALGTGWASGAAWREVEIVSDEVGAPHLRLHGETDRMASARGVRRLHVTLTHTRELAGAYVVLEGDVADAPAPAAATSEPVPG